MLPAPIATTTARSIVTGRLGLSIKSISEHRVITVGMHHHGIKTHLLAVGYPLLPMFVVPARAAGKKVMPVEHETRADEGVIGYIPTIKIKWFISGDR